MGIFRPPILNANEADGLDLNLSKIDFQEGEELASLLMTLPGAHNLTRYASCHCPLY